MAREYISLQGELYLAKLVEGVPTAMRKIGNVPELQLEISADILEHKESMTGQRTTDYTLVQQTNVSFNGTLEEASVENIEYILSGSKAETESKTVNDESLGTVEAGQEIKLNGYDLSAVSFKDSNDTPTTIGTDKYTLDSKFGTVIFNDVSGLTMPILATYTTGKTTQITIASDFQSEYRMFFKGINTTDGRRVAVTLWRTKKSPETTFQLIHEELGQYQITGNALADTSKGMDPTLGLYGNVVVIP